MLKKMPVGGYSRDFGNNYSSLISAWGNRVETLVVTLWNLPVGVAVIGLDARSCGRVIPCGLHRYGLKIISN
jgi:hypothetical protein